MEIIDFKTFVERIPTLISEKNVTVLGQSDRTCVLYGKDNFNRIDGIDAFKTHNFGGVIVNFKGDVSIANYMENYLDFGKDFLNKLKTYLTNKGLNCSTIGNDLIVDNTYKVASYMSQRFGDVTFTGIHISMNVDLDIIKQICTKEMLKIPKGLTDFGITTDEIIDFININI